MLRVFVYGTLKPGQSNHSAYCGDRTIAVQTAKVRGQLFDLPMGYLLSFTDEAVLADLDRLEDYSSDRSSHENEYQREWIEVFDGAERSQGFAWAYFMSLEKVEQSGGTLVADGEWQSA
jgi:gamma-glutamylcyclotransferase (GGCT)/AIG2-like uncharacterized protein YtfP